MTLPNERSHAVRRTREFLRSLLNSAESPGVPKRVRDGAYWCLRHFPADYHINAVADNRNFSTLPHESTAYAIEDTLPLARRQNSKPGATKG